MSEYIVEVIGQMPDAIYERAIEEIVRCRDCRHRRTIDLSVYYYGEHEHDLDICIRVDGVQLNAEPDGFCAWAERRTNE